MTPLSLVKRAQGIQLAGALENTYSYDFGAAPDEAREHELSPYEGFGAISGSYDLNATGAVAEIKRALIELARHAGIQDQAVALLSRDSDQWSDAASIAFATMISRYRSSMPWGLSEPFMQTGQYPSKPQPAVNGLEMLAGAVNTELGDNSGYELARYEAWRGGTFKPPSVISRPPSNAPVTPTYDFTPNTFVPDDASSDQKQAVADFDALTQGIAQHAMSAKTEAERAQATSAFLAASQDRESAALLAISSSDAMVKAAADCAAGGGAWQPNTQLCVLGPTSVPPVPTPRPASQPIADGSGHLAAFILLGGAGLAAYFYYKKSKQ